MSTAYTRFFILASIILFLLEGCVAWTGAARHRALFNKLDQQLVNDLAVKAETVWHLKENYSRFKTYALGEMVYFIRTNVAAMVRIVLRCQFNNDWTVTDLVRNVTNLQLMAQQLFVLQDELVRLHNEILYDDNPRNLTRVISGGGSCQVAGSMPENMYNVYRSRRQLNEARREHIAKTYLRKQANKPSIDIKKQIAQTFRLKVDTRLEAPNLDKNYVDLAPDFL